MWASLVIGRYRSRGSSWQDKVLFLLDLKDSLLLWGVLRADLGEDSLLSPSISSWLTGGPSVCLCLCLCLVSLGASVYFFFISYPILNTRPSV